VSSDLSRALGSGALFLAGMYLVARAVANQFMPYSGEAAFANLILILFVVCVGARAAGSRRRSAFSTPLASLAALWLSLYVHGLLRSPNWGVAVPLASDAALYILILLSGVLWISSESAPQRPAVLQSVMAAFVAMVCVEAVAGIWQFHIDLPRLHADISSGREVLPEALQGALGLARVRGSDIFGTFGNPNSLAAYLVAGLCLLLPFLVGGNLQPRRRNFTCVLLALIFWALWLTRSKGGLVAAAAGLWFFGVQHVSENNPPLRRRLYALTAAGVVLLLLLLVLGFLTLIPMPESLVERFGYWRAALNMFIDHPATGVGLGGFADHFPFYKIPLGKETREAHNDYLHMLAELGPLGPVFYMALWTVILRASSRVRLNAPAPTAAPAETNQRSTLVLAGGLVSFVLLYLSFQPFGSIEVLKLFSGLGTSLSMLYVIQTLLLPCVFAAVFIILRQHSEIKPSCIHGFRAASGAILIHQLIDFDFRAQAVLTGLLLLGGIYYGLAAPEPSPETQNHKLENRNQKLSGIAIALLALLLIPAAVYVPLYSGLPRAAAENREDEIRELQRADNTTPAAQRNASILELREEIAVMRQKAVDHAPFDSAAWLDLAQARSALREDVLPLLKEAERLRPIAPHPKVVLGDFFFRQAASILHQDHDAATQLGAALSFYQAGGARYPFSPGLRLLTGDALLLLALNDERHAKPSIEHLNGAAAEYLAAFRTDMSIDDVNVRFATLFTDPRSAAFPRHGQDSLIAAELNRKLALTESGTPPYSAEIWRAFLFRKIIAWTALLQENTRRHFLQPDVLKRLQSELTLTFNSFIAKTDDISERAHAALLLAMSCQIAPVSATEKAAFWHQARAFQDESIAVQKPGTPSGIFKFLEQRFGR